MARMSLDELRTRASTVDRAKVDATSEVEIEAHRAADGDADLDVTDGARVVESPRALRVRLGMTQPEMAAALCIPLGTWRNWEQGRVSLEPAAMALLRLVSADPDAALGVLSPKVAAPRALRVPSGKAYTIFAPTTFSGLVQEHSVAFHKSLYRSGKGVVHARYYSRDLKPSSELEIVETPREISRKPA